VHLLAVVLASAALIGVLVRPFRVNEAWWASGGAVLLVATGALSLAQASAALLRGLDVYLFLIGMMALAEFAREEGVFAWIAAFAVRSAHGSQRRLLLVVYGAGVITTAFLSNDATIVVLTPAVIAALRSTDAPVEPYVVACALVANAASLMLPIANPSNLLFFADRVPPLGEWFASFGLASVVAVVLTYAAIAVIFRNATSAHLAVDNGRAAAPRTIANVTLALAVFALVATASLGAPLGRVACALGIFAALIGMTRSAQAPLAIARGIAWPIVVLTAALFVIVETLDLAGAAALPKMLFAWAAHVPGPIAQLGVAGATAVASNIVNNLPVGLDVGKYVGSAHPLPALSAAALAGVNLGPNFTTNGSLATLLWLAILRREGIPMSSLRFAVIGLLAAPAALAAAAVLAR
jgi:arsenical pump membrane protein